MTELKCDVDTCTNNKQNSCCLSCIDVKGSAATESMQTFCASYAQKDGSFTNDMSSTNASLDIKCKAKKCVHNCNGGCGADSVGISGSCAQNEDQTQCSSFSPM